MADPGGEGPPMLSAKREETPAGWSDASQSIRASSCRRKRLEGAVRTCFLGLGNDG